MEDQTILRTYKLSKPLSYGCGKRGNELEPWHFQPLETIGISIYGAYVKIDESKPLEDGNKIYKEGTYPFYYAYQFRPITQKLKDIIDPVVYYVWDRKQKGTVATCGVLLNPEIVIIQSSLKALLYNLGNGGKDGITGTMNTLTENALISYKINNSMGSDSSYNKSIILSLITSSQ